MLGVFLDTETNGLNPKKHTVLEIAFKIVNVCSGQLIDEYHSLILISELTWKLSDPESLKVNGFTWEETQRGKGIEKVSEEIEQIFEKNKIIRGNAVFICQNPSFDRIFFSQLLQIELQEKLRLPYHWLDLASMYWAESMRRGREQPEFFPWKTGVSKDKIAKAYLLAEEAKPHRATQGVDHLLLCYDAVVGFPSPSLKSTK